LPRIAAADVFERLTLGSRLASRAARALAGGVAFALIAAFPLTVAHAQRVLTSLDDATVVPRGSVRVGIGVNFSRADKRFASGRPGGAARGERESLGGDFALDSLAPGAGETITTLTPTLRSLSGQTALSLSLGALGIGINRDIRTIPFTMDVGLTSRITLGVLVPYVLVRNDVAVVPGAGGNLGLNPATVLTAARTRNGTVLAQMAAASSRLRAQLAACQSDPSGAGCGVLNANRPAALAFLTQVDAAATDLAAVYGTASAAGARFAPIVGSSLEQSIFARLSAFNVVYQNLLALPAESLLVTARPVGATRLTLNDVGSILSDASFGLGTAIGSTEHGHVGDIEVGGKVLLYDGFAASTSRRLARNSAVKLRLAVGAAYRFATGTIASPSDFTDVGTGDGAADIEARGYLDLVVGNYFWQSAVVRYGIPMKDTVTLRIPDPAAPFFPAAYREQVVNREPGTYIEAEWNPRLVLNDFFAIAGQYRYRRKDVDVFSGTFNVTDPSGKPVTLDAATLGPFSDTEEHRAGVALSYSTVAAYARRSGAPLELTLLLTRVVRGAGVPAATNVALSARWYHKLFGPNNLRR